MQTFDWTNKEGIAMHGVDWHIKSPAAVVVLVHGQGEHIGRYAHVADWYNRHGLAVTGFDQQGYGRSGGARGHARGITSWMDDIEQFLHKTTERYPGLPVFLYGHSMGGAEVLNFCQERNPALAGLIATSPLIRLAFVTPKLKVLAGKVMRRFMPTLTLPTGLAAQFISHDPEVVNAYLHDRLVHGKVSASGGLALLEMSDRLDKCDPVFQVPTLIMHGSDDRITSAAASAAFCTRAKGDVTWREWEGLWHEMHNEPQKEQLFEYTLAWMHKYLAN
jgi:alpha-beta hydrolase superfamily lysophospholipase